MVNINNNHILRFIIYKEIRYDCSSFPYFIYYKNVLNIDI